MPLVHIVIIPRKISPADYSRAQYQSVRLENRMHSLRLNFFQTGSNFADLTGCSNDDFF